MLELKFAIYYRAASLSWLCHRTTQTS